VILGQRLRTHKSAAAWKQLMRSRETLSRSRSSTPEVRDQRRGDSLGPLEEDATGLARLEVEAAGRRLEELALRISVAAVFANIVQLRTSTPESTSV
jgi:hypothetical protein